MKLATLHTEQGPTVVSVTDHEGQLTFYDVRAFDDTLPPSLKGVLSLEDGLERACKAAKQAVEADRQITGTLCAPIPQPGKVICIGLNYRDHAEETGMAFPDEPVCFSKFTTSVTGPDQPIRIPEVAKEVDYEAELVVVIMGCRCRCTVVVCRCRRHHHHRRVVSVVFVVIHLLSCVACGSCVLIK